MYSGKLVRSQLTTHLPMHSFRRCVHRYRGGRCIESFTYRESLRDIDASLDTITQVLSLILFEKIALFQILSQAETMGKTTQGLKI